MPYLFILAPASYFLHCLHLMSLSSRKKEIGVNWKSLNRYAMIMSAPGSWFMSFPTSRTKWKESEVRIGMAWGKERDTRQVNPSWTASEPRENAVRIMKVHMMIHLSSSSFTSTGSTSFHILYLKDDQSEEMNESDEVRDRWGVARWVSSSTPLPAHITSPSVRLMSGEVRSEGRERHPNREESRENEGQTGSNLRPWVLSLIHPHTALFLGHFVARLHLTSSVPSDRPVGRGDKGGRK